MKKLLPVLAALGVPSLAMADTNFDLLVSTTQSYFATAAGVAVVVTVFFIGRRLLKKGAGG